MSRWGSHGERHAGGRVGWLRAAVLGANDGIVSTAALIVGVASADTSRQAILLTGAAGLVAGAMSMAAGEYVSVSSQADSEAADIARERRELATMPEQELDEMTEIYVARGLTRDLARQVAEQFAAGDALAAHTRDELGITEHGAAKPVQAALASAASFAVGALLPIAAALLAPASLTVWAVSGAALVVLAALGWTGARLGSAPALRPALRVTFWGAAALALTAVLGEAFGAVF